MSASGCWRSRGGSRPTTWASVGGRKTEQGSGLRRAGWGCGCSFPRDRGPSRKVALGQSLSGSRGANPQICSGYEPGAEAGRCWCCQGPGRQASAVGVG